MPNTTITLNIFRPDGKHVCERKMEVSRYGTLPALRQEIRDRWNQTKVPGRTQDYAIFVESEAFSRPIYLPPETP